MFHNLKKIWLNFGAKDALVLIGAIAEIYAISLIFNLTLSLDFIVFVLLIATFQYFYDSIKEYYKIKFTEKNVVNSKKVSHLVVFLIIVITLMIGIVYRYSNKFSLFFLFILILLGLLYPIFFKRLTKKYVGFKDIFRHWLESNDLVLFFLLRGHDNFKYCLFYVFCFYSRFS